MTKQLSRWLSEVPLRQVRIWWHWRHIRPGPEQFTPPDDPEITWHVELKEIHPLEDHGQREQRGWWTKTEDTFTGYDKDPRKAIAKALRVAREARKR